MEMNQRLLSQSGSISKSDSGLYLSAEDSIQYPAGLCIETTFREMMYRKVQRKFFGEMLEDESAWTVFWVLMVIPWFSVYLYNFFHGEVSLTVDNAIRFLGAFFLVLVILSSATGLMRWILYWPIGAYVLWVYYPAFITSDIAAIIIVVCLEFVTVGGYYIRKLVYPLLIRRVFTPQCWWGFRLSKRKINSFSYHAAMDTKCRRYPCSRCKVSYTGEVHPITRVPHGFGKWLDDEFFGECLQGWWRDGLPVGPFVSRMTGTSSVFLCTRIAFVTNSTDEWHTRALVPMLTEHLGYGVASVECNVSGTFLHNMPHVLSPFTLERRECTCGEKCQCVRKCTEALERENLKDITAAATTAPSPTTAASTHLFAVSHDGGNSFDVPHFQVTVPHEHQECNIRLRRVAGDSNTLELAIPNALQVHHEQPRTALVLIPGYNCPLSDALKRLAQLYTLAQFPSHIKPFVFHWPSGNIPSYFMAKKIAESEQMRHDFTTFVKGLLEAGFVQMHILAHSMGARVLLNAFEGFHDLLSVAAGSRSSMKSSEEKQANTMTLNSLTLLHPDYSLNRFISNFAAYRHVCDLITLYADPNDGALSWAQRFTKEASLGLHLRQLRQPDDGSGKGQRWLNMDVMDTSSVVNNVHTIRHSFFDLNTTIIEDLRELVTMSRRASARTARVIPKVGNTFTFLTVPAWVKN